MRLAQFDIAPLGKKEGVGRARNFIPTKRDFVLTILITIHFMFVLGNRSALFSKFNARQVRSRFIICSAPRRITPMHYGAIKR